MAALTGKCALVTGSTGGLGLAIAERLAADGCHLVLNGLGDPGEIERARASLDERSAGRVLYHPADLADPVQIADLVKTAESAFGAVDILVNNAVVRHFAPIDAFPVERWDEALAVNVSAPFHLIRLALPAMRRRNWGRIVNLSSIYGFRAAAERVDYVTAKTALLGMTRAVALDVIGHDITCNAVCPGTVETPAIAARIDTLAAAEGLPREEAVRRYLATRQPTGRFVAAEGVAALVAFLCSPEARDITAAALPVDGGWSAV